MNIKRLSGLMSVLLLGLAGCAAGTNVRNDIARPLGYYSNENHQNKTSGFFADNDGPLTELMDHSLGDETDIANRQRKSALQTRDENGNPPNPTTPLAEEDQFLRKDNRFSTGDVNYHDHLNQNVNNTGFSTDQQTHAKISDQIRRKAAGVGNVRDVHSVVYGSSVLIFIDLIDKSKAGSTEKAVEKAVKPYVKGRSVTVITDEGTFSRDRNNQTGVRAEGAK